jgi:hypothetical protein
MRGLNFEVVGLVNKAVLAAESFGLANSFELLSKARARLVHLAIRYKACV